MANITNECVRLNAGQLSPVNTKKVGDFVNAGFNENYIEGLNYQNGIYIGLHRKGYKRGAPWAWFDLDGHETLVGG